MVHLYNAMNTKQPLKGVRQLYKMVAQSPKMGQLKKGRYRSVHILCDQMYKRRGRICVHMYLMYTDNLWMDG